MALRLYLRRPSGVYHLRGTHHGIRVDESTLARTEREAEGVKEKREREIYEQVVLGKKPDRSFAEAALGYMKSGGEKAPLAKILAAKIKAEGRDQIFGKMLLKDVDQSAIDTLAETLFPAAKSSTRNRHIYTPVSAVLVWASEQKSWGFQHGRLRRPAEPPGRIDWRTPQEIEWWLKRAGAAAPLITAHVGTGARAGELQGLDWPNVTPAGHRITLWEEDTKARRARGVDLQLRVRGVLPERPASGKGAVFVKRDGERWSKIGFAKALDRITIAAVREAARQSEGAQLAELISASRTTKGDALSRLAAARQARALVDEIAERENIPWIHPHVFRHTWATWAYAVTRDLPWVMAQGGWASTDLAMRYIHVASGDLAEDVLAHGWEIRPLTRDRPLALPKPASDQA